MSHAVQAVVGVVEIVAGAVIDIVTEGTGGNSLIAMGVAQLLSYAVTLLLDPRRRPLEQIGNAYSGTLMGRRIIFGQLKVSGMYVNPPMCAGASTEQLDALYTGPAGP